MLKYTLEGVLLVALFVVAVVWDVATAIDVEPSRNVQLRMFILLYGAVWTVRLTIRAARAVMRALKPQPWRVLGWLAFAAWVTLLALVVGPVQFLKDMATGALELLKRETANWVVGLIAFVAVTFLLAAIRRRRWANNIPALEAEIDKKPDPERRAALIRLHGQLMAKHRAAMLEKLYPGDSMMQALHTRLANAEREQKKTPPPV